MDQHASDATGVRVAAFGRSDRGKVRKTNQDNLLLLDLRHGEAAEPRAAAAASDSFTVGPVEFALGESGAVLLVADGMGGRAGGARASAATVHAVGEAMADGSRDDAEAFVERIGRALALANASVYAEGSSDDSLRGMGTTATLAGLLGGSVYVAQVGDSRAYLARNGSMVRLTRDQSLVQDLIDMGVLSEEEAASVPSNQILQALGVAPQVEPVVTYHELRRGDVLLLCSDGLSGVVTDAEVGSAITEAPTLSDLCDRLVSTANERGGPDNITVLAARIEGEGLREPGDEDLEGPTSYPQGRP